MSEEVNDEGHLRKYLLGELTEAEQQTLEERLMTETELFDLLPVAEDELIDDYLGGALSAYERGKLESFFLSTPERRRKLSFAMALRRYVTKEAAAEAPAAESQTAKPSRGNSAGPSSVIGHAPWWNRAFSSPYVRMAAAAVIVLGLGLGIWRVFFYQSEVAKGMAALRNAYPEQGPIEARITGLNSAPSTITRGSDRGAFSYDAHRRAQRFLEDEAEEHPGASSFHALGRLYLAEGNIDEAITQFDKALKLDEKNAELHSDYGAALLEKAKSDHLKNEAGQRLEVFAQSLEHLTKAVELNSSLPEALFNRALLYQEMQLPAQAEEDLRAYLEKDPNSKWSDEARSCLKRLEEQKGKRSQEREQVFQDFLVAYQLRDDQKAWSVFSQGRTRTGNLIVENLLDSYLDLMVQGKKKEAAGKLQMLSYAAEVERHKVGDNFTSDLARCYEHSTPAQREILVEARNCMKEAGNSFNRSEFARAISIYVKANRLFDQANNNPEASLAESWIGNSYLRVPNTERSLPIFERLSRTSKQRKHLWLYAQSLNAISDAQTSLDALSRSLDYAERSLEEFERIQDTGGVLRNLQQFVSMYLKFGNHHESLSYSMRGFDLARAFTPDPKQMWPFYHETAFDFYWLGFLKAALEFEKEALRLAFESKWPLIISRSYTRLGLIYEKLQNSEEAIRNGQLALEQGESITDTSGRLNTTANASLRLGRLYRKTGNLNRAIESCDRAIQSYDKLNLHIYLYEAHKEKLLAFISLGDDSAAKEELTAALNLFEQYRNKIWEESNRNSFFDAGQSIYDIAAGFAFSRMNDPEKAFEHSETSRARSLLELMRTGAQVIDGKDGTKIRLRSVTEPMPVSEIRRRLPERAQILQYAVLDDKLIIWVVSKTNIQGKEEKIASDELSQKVSSYLDLISKSPASNTPDASGYAKELYNVLIAPVEEFLNNKKELCIVPDKILNRLPYGSLISPISGRYFIEDFTLESSPSSNIFVSCTEEATKKEGPFDEKLLSVGDPSFERSRSLPDLPSARKEAEQVAGYYHSPITLTDDRATEKQVEHDIVLADVVHLATHCVIDERFPLLSRLLLAKESGPSREDTDGALRASEIYKMKLPRTRLVILSACKTGFEHSYGGEGAISIARPFISAGVPIVIASLWSAESESTAILMVSFHKHRKQDGLSTVEALRQAQLDMLRGADERYRRPYYWASFTCFGGDTKF